MKNMTISNNESKKLFFSSEYLLKNEEILFETRPALIIYLIKPIVWTLLINIGIFIISLGIGSLETAPESFDLFPLIIGGVLWIIALIIYPIPFLVGFFISVLIFGFVFNGFNFTSIEGLDTDLMMTSIFIGFVIVTVIGFILTYYEWKNTQYVFTNQRFVALYGFYKKTFAFCYHPKVQSVLVMQSFREERFHFGTLVFATASTAGGSGMFGRGVSSLIPSTGAVVWRSIPNPMQTVTEIENMISKTPEP
jgi:hypothetical protein